MRANKDKPRQRLVHKEETISNLSGNCAIAGVGETKVGRLPEVSTLWLHLEAIKRCVEDAGLKSKDVDGLLTNQPLNEAHQSFAIRLAHLSGITPRYTTDLALGGATPIAMVQHAVLAINAGLCNTVVCVHARKNGSGEPVAGPQGERRFRGFTTGHEDISQPYGLFGAVAIHALIARRHMYEFGTKSEDLAHIAVVLRKHACLNANATMCQPISIADHQASRWIVRPLHLLDCCLESDGGGAVLVTSAERAKDMPKPPIYILGMGQHHPHFTLTDAQQITTLGGRVSSEIAYQMAGLGPKNMEFAQIYDCFTITVLVTLEDYGFCKKGEGKDFVKGGRIEIGGSLPVNTHGGLLSQAHIEGMLHITEAVKQLRGGEVEPERQIKNPQVGIVSGHGGNASMHATLILGRTPN